MSHLYSPEIISQAKQLLSKMTLDEKLGQLSQVSSAGAHIPDDLANAIRHGRVSSVINEVDLATNNELQRLAVRETRLGIPLLIGRDVIHGFKTIFPIPLGQAATWSPEIVEKGARIAGEESATVGVNWTFAPMIDIARDPRWGRIAESLGEDPFLCAALCASMVKGFQTDDLSSPGAIASCVKHFAGYGASESGRDYNATNIPENELRNVYLPPFQQAAKAGVASFMTSFSDLNGVPATGNRWLLKQVLRDEWNYQGLVVSDWESIKELQVHGLSASQKESAYLAAKAGVDMEMASHCYIDNMADLIAENQLNQAEVDQMVLNVLHLKFALGLFENAFTDASVLPQLMNAQNLQVAKEAAQKSCVLLQNKKRHGNTPVLPINRGSTQRIAVIGPMAHDGYEQLGTWVFDGEEKHSVTCLSGLKALAGQSIAIEFESVLCTSRDSNTQHFDKALELTNNADVAILYLGEESILSGEAHCRANIDLPGAQLDLIEHLSQSNTPIVLVVLAGRPLTLQPILDKVDSILYAWHPGTMGGLAIAELLFGDVSPSGKLPVSFPRVVGQIPIYYAQKNSGRPPTEESFIFIDDVPVRAAQTSLGMAATHLDTHFSPLYPFGFGLSYANFEYHHVNISQHEIKLDSTFSVSLILENKSDVDAEEIVQLYIRDLVGSVTRPVRELKGFKRVLLKAKSSVNVMFEMHTDDLAFYDICNQLNVEIGDFLLGVGADSSVELSVPFSLVK
ncbi:glycoside hydrolase family 3 N-terminal domain-containing protein [Glaciecola sp. 33A]|jgi:beta-glucosidase|uniref:glycoside hydrolase family 3 N-terminal domain-containing protein n=1 Tax=Glaciecola sp. 33A TaxID=2057807 RepID=UPI000C34463C|nr:glycoside hydrolase family 3 N-terminal domain-containing protein [Glaciecola sp. 33A]PKI03620.1 glycosyl hydrolase [Glaciecola sp. 33A]